MTILTTRRLRLEPFNDSHFDGLQAMNRLPEVMRYISGQPETPEQTRAAIQRVQVRWAEWGHSWWSFIDRRSDQLVGAGCVQYLAADRANPLELGWRLRPENWHQGLASEAARAMAGFAFDQLQAPRIVAVCHPDNVASAKVMTRLGMQLRGTEYWYNMDVLLYALERPDWLRSAVAQAED